MIFLAFLRLTAAVGIIRLLPYPLLRASRRAFCHALFFVAGEVIEEHRYHTKKKRYARNYRNKREHTHSYAVRHGERIYRIEVPILLRSSSVRMYISTMTLVETAFPSLFTKDWQAFPSPFCLRPVVSSI